MISVKVYDLKGFKEELTRRGWKEGRFNGEACMLKEEENWLWICLVFGEEVKFASFPVEESSRVHSEGIKKLLEEIRNLSGNLDVWMIGKVEYGA